MVDKCDAKDSQTGQRYPSKSAHDFVPTDWLDDNYGNNEIKKKYFDIVKLKKPNFLVQQSGSKDWHKLGGCIGEIFAGPKSFSTATRNPINSVGEYLVTVYHFNSSLLPDCKGK